MKKITLTIIAAMLALPAFAALQMVDLTTLTTNTVINTVYPGIMFTNFSTNYYIGYSTLNTNAVQSGETISNAFTKVNANFTYLGAAITNLNYRSGITNIPTLTTSQSVLFSTPFPPAIGTNYCVNVSFDTALAAAVGFPTTAKTTNGFTVTLSGTITGAVLVDYAAWPYK